MRKKLMKAFKGSKQFTTLLTILCLGLIYGNIHQATTYSKSVNAVVEKYQDMLIIQEPDVMESDLPHKKLGKFELTWYSSDPKCVGKKKIIKTASGTTPKANRTIAVDPNKIPIGSIVYIENYGYFIAEDTGSAVKGNIIDIYTNNYKDAIQNGRKIANVYLLK